MTVYGFSFVLLHFSRGLKGDSTPSFAYTNLLLFFFCFFGILFSDNDMVIGNRNRGKMERSSVLKNRKLPQNRHAQCKVIPNTTEDSVKAKKSKEDRDQNESNLKGSKGSVTACPMPRRQIRAGKPAPKRT